MFIKYYMNNFISMLHASSTSCLVLNLPLRLLPGCNFVIDLILPLGPGLLTISFRLILYMLLFAGTSSYLGPNKRSVNVCTT